MVRVIASSPDAANMVVSPDIDCAVKFEAEIRAVAVHLFVIRFRNPQCSLAFAAMIQDVNVTCSDHSKALE